MKKPIWVVLGAIVVVPIAITIGSMFWWDYLSYYWYTEMIEGTSFEREVRLCGSSHNNYVFEIHPTAQNNELLAKAHKSASTNKNFYFKGRGFIYQSEQGDTIQIVELSKLLPITTSECTLTK